MQSNEPCTDPDWNSCVITKRTILSTNSVYSFTLCIFSKIDGGSADGGAIYASGGTTELTVKDCAFIDCSSTSQTNYYSGGGAIYTESISSISVINSDFVWNKSSKQAYSGGALTVRFPSSTTIRDNTFTKCCIGSSGGAIYIQSSSPDRTSTVIENCRILNCKGTTNGGGGICAHLNYQYNDLITECLFSLCTNYYGGGLYLYHPTSSSGQYPVHFCFFNKNSISKSGGYGNDVYLEWYNPNNDPVVCFHCHSTSDSVRVGYRINHNDLIFFSNDYIWLPQTNAIIKVFDPITTANEISTHRNMSDDNDQ